MPQNKLTDRFGRTVNYVRLSVTDRCDFRCVYCMAEDMTFLPRQQVLTLEEIARVARNFVDLGTEKIRLTGGEPLVRKDILELVKEIGTYGLRDFAMTTNGSQLTTMAEPLRKAGMHRRTSAWIPWTPTNSATSPAPANCHMCWTVLMLPGKLASGASRSIQW